MSEKDRVVGNCPTLGLDSDLSLSRSVIVVCPFTSVGLSFFFL